MSRQVETQRREVTFSGRVQGVGFRYTTRAIAARHDVRGFVQNLPDGRVLLVVEGSPQTLERFIAAVETEMDRHVDNTNVTISDATGEFSAFEVRY